MKVRHGFVSNSSSSSFLIVGIDSYRHNELFEQIMELDHFNDEDYGYGISGHGDKFIYYGSSYEPDYIGIDVAEMLETMTLPAIREHVHNMFASYGIDVPIAMIDLHYGEVGDG